MLEEAERLARTANDRALVAYARFYQGMLRCQGDDLRRGIAAEEAGIALLDALSPGDRERLHAIETTSDPLDAQNGRGELTLALAENGRLGQALELGERIVALPPEDTFGSRGDAWYGLGYACAALGRPDAATRAFRSARQTFAANDYRGMVTASLFDELTMVVVPFRLDQPAERVRLETELEQSLAALAGISDSRSARCAYVFSMVLSGEWEGIFELLDQSGLRFMRRNIPMLLAPIARLQGNAGLAWELIQQAFPSGSVGDPEDAVLDAMPLRAVAIALALDANDLVGARRWLESFDTWLAWSGSVLGCADAQLAWAGYERSIGDHAASRMRAEQALTAAEAPRQPIVLLAAHRFLGECDLTDGQIDPAEAHLTEALALAVATESAHERALTLIVQAELRLRQGRAAAARALLETARALCEPMNAALTLARIERLDARLPGAPSVASTPLPAGLTPREADVLRLLATGLPNAEIAERLNLSSRTIDTYSRDQEPKPLTGDSNSFGIRPIRHWTSARNGVRPTLRNRKRRKGGTLVALLTIQHTVQDFAVWRSVYDSLDEVQRDWGVTEASVHQMASAPDVVLVIRHFATVAQARGFLTSREIQGALQRSGVEGEPRIEIYA
jgi:tetratricopeptide (TPR) repeat protein